MYLAYQESGKERLCGSAAKNQAKKNINRTFNNLMRLIGIGANDQEQLEKEKIFSIAKMAWNNDLGRVCAKVDG